MIRKVVLFFKKQSRPFFIIVSNGLTLARIALTPVIFFAIVHHQWRTALVLFGVAAITDIGDGFFARLFNAQTVFGACLDPLADKFLILSSFVALAWLRSDVFVIPSWFIVFFFIREFLIVLGALIVAIRGGKTMIEPTIWGKVTTFLQIIFIVWLTICFIVGWKPQKTYAFFLIFLVTFSFFSFMHYLKVGLSRARVKKK